MIYGPKTVRVTTQARGTDVYHEPRSLLVNDKIVQVCLADGTWAYYPTVNVIRVTSEPREAS